MFGDVVGNSLQEKQDNVALKLAVAMELHKLPIHTLTYSNFVQEESNS